MSVVKKVSVVVRRKTVSSPGWSRKASPSLESLGSPSTEGEESTLSSASGDRKLAALVSL